MNKIFELSNFLIPPFWFLMIFLPHWKWTRRIISSPLIIVPPAVLYGLLVVPRFFEIMPVVLQPTLVGVAALLGSEVGAVIGWAHFLAFDLFVGRWIYLDSGEKNISAWLMAPILFFTLMLGPLGFLSYLLLREIYRRFDGAKKVAE
ncbi:MAG: ABA4-like family protein [Acidobacteriota bacterium]|nr:ABA4-like family protein [Acidobacteriota bacterium]